MKYQAAFIQPNLKGGLPEKFPMKSYTQNKFAIVAKIGEKEALKTSQR